MGLGWPELLVILVIVLLLFGAKRLPEMAGSLGQSIKEFRKATAEASEESEQTDESGQRDDAGPSSDSTAS